MQQKARWGILGRAGIAGSRMIPALLKRSEFLLCTACDGVQFGVAGFK